MNLDDKNEKVIEALLPLALEENLEEEILEIENTYSFLDDYNFTEKYNKNKNNIITKYKRKTFYEKVQRHSKRIAIAFIVISVTTFSGLMVSVEAFRVKVLNMSMEVFDKNSHIEFKETDDNKINSSLTLEDFESRFIERLETDYKLIESASTSTSIISVYENSEKDCITISKDIIHEGLSLAYDIEDRDYKQVFINETEVTFSENEEKGLIVYFIYNDYVYTITTNLNFIEIKDILSELL